MKKNIPIPTRSELRKFGLTMAVIISMLFGLIIPFIGNGSYPTWPWAIGLFFTILSLTRPKSLYSIYIAWMKIGHVLGWINTRIILAILFFGLLSPIAFILRLLKKDPLSKNFDSNLSTYRVPCKPIEPSEFERPF